SPIILVSCPAPPRPLPSFPTRRSSDLHRADLAHLCVHTVRVLTLEAGVQRKVALGAVPAEDVQAVVVAILATGRHDARLASGTRSEEHTSELQSRENLVCRLLLEKKK